MLLSAVPAAEEPSGEDVLPEFRLRTAPEPEAEAEPEPEPDTLAPDEAYMTYKGLSAISVEEPQAHEREEDSGDDAYEDWTPRKT